jgi:glycosyltransferase involved in cell wall biosynthesis
VSNRKIILFANTDWYLYNFRISLARRLRERGEDLLLLSPPGEYGSRFLEMGFRWLPADMDRRSLNPLTEARLIRSLVSLFRAERPDIVHGLTIKCSVYGSLAARMAGVPGRVNAVNGLGYVFTSGDLRARALRPVVRNLMRLAFGGAGARLVVQNPDDRAAFLQACLVSEHTIRLIPGSGVDVRRFCPADRAQTSGSPFRVLLPARLLWDKGVGEFVGAASLLKGRNIRFMIAGNADPGNPASVPPQVAAKWCDSGVVELLGHVEDMPALFREVDAVVLPSYREGLPRALIEAGATGVPLVTTDVPGCREVVCDGVDGLITPVRNVEALAQAISRLQEDAALAKQLGAAARAKAVALFDERIILARTLEVYDELVPTAGVAIPPQRALEVGAE